jgi:hypothetical protein
MLQNSFQGVRESEHQATCALAQQTELTDAERTSLRSFVEGLGERIRDDTSPFTATEQKRLTFLRWLSTSGRVSD